MKRHDWSRGVLAGQLSQTIISMIKSHQRFERGCKEGVWGSTPISVSICAGSINISTHFKYAAPVQQHLPGSSVSRATFCEARDSSCISFTLGGRPCWVGAPYFPLYCAVSRVFTHARISDTSRDMRPPFKLNHCSSNETKMCAHDGLAQCGELVSLR